MGVDRNNLREQQLLEKLMKNTTGASGLKKQVQLTGQAEGNDRGKRPIIEKENAAATNKVRREEREEMEGAPLPLVHPRLLSGLSEHIQAGVEKCIMLHREKDLVRVAELWRLRDEMGKKDAEVE
ncbi:Hypothetical predicted protein, partial [Prunus dulcis]